MSEKGNQSNQRGGQQRSGQPQGGQPQGSRGQGAQQQPPGRGPGRPQPPGGGESAVDALQRSGPKQFMKGIAALSAIGGVLFSVMMILVMKVGGFPVLPGATEQARSAAAAAGQLPTGTAGGASATQMLDTGISTSHQVIVAYMSTELAPFLAFGLALVAGLLVATRMDDSSQAKYATAGAGMFVGGLLFVVISSALIGLLGPSIPESLMAMSGNNLASAAINTDLSAPQWGNIFVNGLVTGIAAAGAAVGTVYSVDSFILE